jgi:hypothetical protein
MIRSHAKRILSGIAAIGRELRHNLRLIVNDLTRANWFWIAVLVGVLTSIVGAMAISSHMPRLAVAATAMSFRYGPTDKPSPELFVYRGQVRAMLLERVRAELGQRVASTFRSDNESDLVGDKQSNKGIDELYPRSLCVVVNVSIKITNVGSLASTLSSLTLNLVEDIDGHRESIDWHFADVGELKLPQGQIVNVGGDHDSPVRFCLSAPRFIDYELVDLVWGKLDWDQREEDNLGPTYLRLLAGNNSARAQRLLRISDPAKHARIILVVEAVDIYGRRGVAETDVVKSTPWERAELFRWKTVR